MDLAALSQCPLLLGRPKPLKGQQLVEEDVGDVMEDFDALEEEVEDMEEEEEKLGSHTDDEEEDDDDKEDDKEGDDLLNDPDFQNMSDSDGDDLPLFGDLSDDEQDDDETTEGTFKERERKGGGGSGRATQVDDQFFKLSDMEKFLEVEDKKWESKDGGASEQTFLDLDDEGEEDSDPRVMYNAFFDDQEANGEGDDVDDESDSDDAEEGEEEEEDDDDAEEEEEFEDGSKNLAGGSKKAHKLLPSDDEDSDDEQVVKSKHELQQERLVKKIAHLEEAAVGSKPWQMGGEVAAPSRGENSLLAEDLEYDTAVRQAPVVTEDVARALEDIIRQRVKDKAWDDVERKVRPVEDPREYKKKLVLDQEKSKLSLAQVYEEEYVKLAEGAEAAKTKTSIGLLDKEVEETPEAVKEIKV